MLYGKSSPARLISSFDEPASKVASFAAQGYRTMVTIDCDKSPKNETEAKLSKGTMNPVADSSTDESDYETSLADESLEIARSHGNEDAELPTERSREINQLYDGSGTRPEDSVGTADLDSIDDVAPQLAESVPRPEGHTRTPGAEETPYRHENGRSGLWMLLTVGVLVVVLILYDIEKTKLQNEKDKNELAQKLAQEKELRRLENEQKQTELAIKKVNQEIEAKKLENEKYTNELTQKLAQEREFRLLENEQKQTELAIKKVIEAKKLENEKYTNELTQKLAQEREFRLLENEQKQTELAIKKVIAAKKLENERLEKQHKHDEKMMQLEYEKKKNETFLNVYKDLLTPRIVNRKKEDSGFFTGRSTETSEDVEIPINKLPDNVKRIVAGTSWSSGNDDEDEHI